MKIFQFLFSFSFFLFLFNYLFFYSSILLNHNGQQGFLRYFC